MVAGLVYTEVRVDGTGDPRTEVLGVKKSLARKARSITKMRNGRSPNQQTVYSNKGGRSLLQFMVALQRKTKEQEAALIAEREAQEEALITERKAREEALVAEREAREKTLVAEREAREEAEESLEGEIGTLTREVTILLSLKEVALQIRERFYSNYRPGGNGVRVNDA